MFRATIHFCDQADPKDATPLVIERDEPPGVTSMNGFWRVVYSKEDIYFFAKDHIRYIHVEQV